MLYGQLYIPQPYVLLFLSMTSSHEPALDELPVHCMYRAGPEFHRERGSALLARRLLP